MVAMDILAKNQNVVEKPRTVADPKRYSFDGRTVLSDPINRSHRFTDDDQID